MESKYSQELFKYGASIFPPEIFPNKNIGELDVVICKHEENHDLHCVHYKDICLTQTKFFNEGSVRVLLYRDFPIGRTKVIIFQPSEIIIDSTDSKVWHATDVEYKLFLMPAGVTLKEWLKNPSPLVQTKFIQS